MTLTRLRNSVHSPVRWPNRPPISRSSLSVKRLPLRCKDRSISRSAARRRDSISMSKNRRVLDWRACRCFSVRSSSRSRARSLAVCLSFARGEQWICLGRFPKPKNTYGRFACANKRLPRTSAMRRAHVNSISYLFSDRCPVAALTLRANTHRFCALRKAQQSAATA
jgi:hypothetical protein